MPTLPTRHQLMQGIIRSLEQLGGSGSVEEIDGAVTDLLAIDDEAALRPHLTRTGKADGRTELEYNLAWARTYLKQMGFVENSSRGVWSLKGDVESALAATQIEISSTRTNADLIEPDWRERLSVLLTKELSPAAFERLVQRILRESGFVQVEVTGRTGDGGIDGRGVAKINGILSFHIVFQCKRYTGAVGAPEIRDFRGALQGRADKGLFLTTGYFTRDAIKEATRDGASAIDLVDGEKLIEKLKDLRLGVNVASVEAVEIDPEWFANL